MGGHLVYSGRCQAVQPRVSGNISDIFYKTCHIRFTLCVYDQPYIQRVWGDDGEVTISSLCLCLDFKMISIYISYELIHACSHPPRTPTPHASLLSFVKIARRLSNVSNFPSGVGWASVSIHSGSARVRNLICATVGKRVGCRFAKWDPCRPPIRMCVFSSLQLLHWVPFPGWQSWTVEVQLSPGAG